MCSIATICVTALGAGSAAAAQPELGRCLGLTNGAFRSATCMKSGAGHFEWFPAFGAENPIVGTGLSWSASAVQFRWGRSGFKCSNGALAGDYSGVRSAELGVLTLTGCIAVKSISTCQTPGLAAGEIRTAPLEGTYGDWAERGKHGVEIDLVPASVGAAFAEFLCGARWVIHGSVMVVVPAGKMLATAALKAAHASEGQSPHESTDGTTARLTVSLGEQPPKPAVLKAKITQKSEEAVELLEG
ncbi:MAG TPA: hypothetical protein VH025_10195 [Solirubrobacteraceae bacterium]|nr:hypothetical protein [Solirubrobacteraceae bacterium]